MKVLYNTCVDDPWIKVAQSLYENYNLEPTYWIGTELDNSEKLIPNVFPNCWYFRRFDVWKGIFPPEISSKWQDGELDIDFLKEIATYELQAIKMMDRMDNDQHSFSFMERQRLFRTNLKLWSAFLKNNKVDIVIGAIVPHRPYDYPLYLLCKKLNIPFIFFKNSAFWGRFVLAKDLYTISEIVANEYNNNLNKNYSLQEYKDYIEKDILSEYNKVQEDYSLAEPDYMKIHTKRDKKEASVVGLGVRLMGLISSNYENYFGKNSYFFKGVPSHFKEKNKSIEDSRLSFISHIFRKQKGISIIKQLKKHYNKLTIVPDYSKKFVFLPLHYQPEMTTSPSGDIFVDQLLCVDILSRNIPDDYILYVKEHPSQLMSHNQGHTSRLKEFYNDILKYKNVRLVPLNSNPFHLIKNSKAVATITGTAGWEAIALKKPVIIFGLSWYEYYTGVLKITDMNKAKQIPNFITNFTFDENNLMAYLKAFQDNSAVAYFDYGYKQYMNISEEESVENIVNYIKKCIEINHINT